ncbi:MAG: ABC transporter permease [Thermodesulfobacteriota bacterium]
MPIFISLTFLGASLASLPVLLATVVVSALCFAVLGTLLSTPPTDDPASIMTLANLVRLPLIFFSGVFLPVRQMPEWGQALSYVSPLTYTTETIRFALGQQTSIHPAPALIMIVVFFLAFWTISHALHKHNIAKRLWA